MSCSTVASIATDDSFLFSHDFLIHCSRPPSEVQELTVASGKLSSKTSSAKEMETSTTCACCAGSKAPAGVSTENKSTSTLNTPTLNDMRSNVPEQSKPNVSRWHHLLPLIVLGICLVVFASTKDDEGFVTVNSDLYEELSRLKRENEKYQNALSWIEERQNTLIKILSSADDAVAESIIKWLGASRTAFYNEFPAKK